MAPDPSVSGRADMCGQPPEVFSRREWDVVASTTANCHFCGATFTGYGETHKDAVADANTQAIHHAFNCPKNPANQE